MVNTSRKHSSATSSLSLMSKDHWTYLLEAEVSQRRDASEDVQIVWQSNKPSWCYPTSTSLMARSFRLNGWEALTTESTLPLVYLVEKISWRPANDMAMEYEENCERLSGCWSLPFTGSGPSPHQWLRTSQDMVGNSQQWMTCCRPITASNNLSSLTCTN